MTERETQRPGLQAWLIVAIGFVALSIGFSGRSALGLTMPLWEAEFGWSRGFVSAGGAVALVVMAMMAPLSGSLVDRFGPRILLSLGLVCLAAGMAATSAIAERWQFFAAFSVLAGVGFGVVAMHVVSTAVALNFERNRGLAVGLATSGSTAGQLLVVPLVAAVMTTVGWKASYLTLAAGALLLAPLCLLLLRRPSRGAVGAAEWRPVPTREALRLLGRSPTFYALLFSFTVCGFTTAGVIETHLLPYAAACGFPPLPSAAAYGVLSAVNLGGMVLAGWLSDRMHRPLLLGTIYILRGLAFILLMRIAGDISLLFVFAVAFGAVDYSTVPVTASLVASHLGLRVMGLTMGVLAAGHALGAAVGAFLGGYLFDLFARYDAVWVASVALAVAAGLVCFTIREGRAGERGTAPAPATA